MNFWKVSSSVGYLFDEFDKREKPQLKFPKIDQRYCHRFELPWNWLISKRVLSIFHDTEAFLPIILVDMHYWRKFVVIECRMNMCVKVNTKSMYAVSHRQNEHRLTFMSSVIALYQHVSRISQRIYTCIGETGNIRVICFEEYKRLSCKEKRGVQKVPSHAHYWATDEWR